MNNNKSLKRSESIMQRSRSIFPGGVNSPVRSFHSVGGSPIVFSHGQGKHLFDVDGNCYVDFCSSWGPLILGYSPINIVKALHDQVEKACSFGAPSELEVQLAEKIQSWVPGIEMLRFVSSGTEATMSAVRVARASTKRNKFVKFEGCYHGHADQFLVKAGSGLATLANPSSAGVPAGTTEDTLIAIYNNKKSVQEIFQKHGSNIAAVIIEPVAANMGLVLAEPDFLPFLRELTNKYGSALIFDEVMTGFRLAKGGAASVFGVEPDLWTFGKIIGGGLPAAAYGGKKIFMEQVAPLGATYQAGTLSGNPMAMRAGYETLLEMERQDAFFILEEKGKKLDELVHQHLQNFIQKQKLCYVRIASFFCFFFGTKQAPKNYTEVIATDMKVFNRVYHKWLDEGIYLGPSGYEVGFLSTCIENHDMEKMLTIIARVLNED